MVKKFSDVLVEDLSKKVINLEDVIVSPSHLKIKEGKIVVTYNLKGSIDNDKVQEAINILKNNRLHYTSTDREISIIPNSFNYIENLNNIEVGYDRVDTLYGDDCKRIATINLKKINDHGKR